MNYHIIYGEKQIISRSLYMIHHIFFKIMHETFENMTKQPNHIYIISHDKIRLVSCTIYRHQYVIPQYLKHCHYFLWWIWQPQELLYFLLYILFCSVWVEKKNNSKRSGDLMQSYCICSLQYAYAYALHILKSLCIHFSRSPYHSEILVYTKFCDNVIWYCDN